MKKTILFVILLLCLSLISTSSVAANQHKQTSQQKDRLLKNKHQCPVTPGRFYTHPQTNAVWRVTNKVPCTKRPVQSSKIFFTYADSWSEVTSKPKQTIKNIKDDSAGFVPKGPKYDPKGGALVKIPSDNRVYLLLDEKKYWITKENIFEALNYKWEWIESVSPELLNKYKTKGEINYTDHHPTGSLIKYPDSNKVYRLEQKNNQIVKRHIKSPEVFNKLNYRFSRVVTIDKGEKYATGQPITIENYRVDNPTSTNLFPARKNGKWGYINQKGKWVIQPKFNYAKPFFEGRAAVNILPATTFDDINSQWGIINKQGEYVVKPKYRPQSAGIVPGSPIGRYSDGLAPVNAKRNYVSYGSRKKIPSGVFYLDRQGNKKLAGKFASIGHFSDGLAPFSPKENKKVGYINKKGEVIIKPKYNAGLLYSNGLIPVQKDSTDKHGFSDGKWKFINKQNQTVLSGKTFESADSFYNGLAKVSSEEGGKYINNKGKTIFNTDSFRDSASFWENKTIVSKPKGDYKSYYAIVDQQGNIVFDLRNLNYNVCGVEPFHNGLAQILISESASCGFSGSNDASEYFPDLVPLSSSTLYAYIDKQGNLVYKEDNTGSNKVKNSLSEKTRRNIKQLYISSKKSVESRNWKEYLKNYTPQGRTNLLNKYYTSFTFVVGFGAMSKSFTGTSSKKIDKLKNKWTKLENKWTKLVEQFNLDLDIAGGYNNKESANKIKQKFSSMNFEEKANFFSSLMELFSDADKEKKPEFGELMDFKAKDNKGAILIQTKDKEDDGDVELEQESRSIIKKSGEWKWSEVF